MTDWVIDFSAMEVKLVQLTLFFVGLIMIALVIRRITRSIVRQSKGVSWLKRAFSVFEMTLFLTLSIWGIHAIFKDQPTLFIIITTAVLTLFLWASRFAIKDLVCGVILKAEDTYRVYDHIRFDNTEGWISKAGLRSLQITAADGQQIRIPYSRISDTLFAKTTEKNGSYVHTFRLEIPKSEPLPAVIEHVRLTIIHCIWSSVVNAPSIRYDSEGSTHYVLEITVHAISKDYFSRIEDKVRRSSMADPKPQNSQVADTTDLTKIERFSSGH